ncbi:MAG: hypothetical protein U0840_05635 [Gemmataceae bacterium]
MVCRCFVAVLLLLAGWVSAKGGELTEPYQVRVVIHMDRHRLLTDVFRQQVRRELGDGLQAALGPLGRVEVTETHPQLMTVRNQGLARGLDGYRERTPYLTFFVLIDFSGSHYRIQTRMHNGLLGLPGPVVRKEQTRDRAFVTRAAVFLMERDLGLVGSVITEPDAAGQVALELRGGQLGVDLGTWVKKGELFRLVRLGPTGPGQVVEWSYLQVQEPPRDGTCRCRVLTRYRLPRLSGLRAELIGARVGPVRLRLLQEKPGGAGPLESPVTLHLRKHGFEGEDSSKLQLTATSSRDIDTSRSGEKGRFDKLVFVSVLSGDNLRARIPMALVDDSLNVVVVPASNEESDLITFRFRGFQRRVLEAYLVQAEQFREINLLTAKADQRARALQRVRETLKRLEDDHSALKAEREEIKIEIAKLPVREQPRPQDLQAIDDRLKLIKSAEADLLKHVAMLEKIEKEENDPKKKEWLIQVERAKLHEKEGEVSKAIAIYEAAPAEFQTDALKQHLAELKKLWEPRNPAHGAARKFVFDVFATLPTEELRGRFKDAQNAYEVFEKHSDIFGMNRLLLSLETIIKRLEKELGELKPENNPDDEKPALLIKELVPEIQKLDRAVRTWQEKKKGSG